MDAIDYYTRAHEAYKKYTSGNNNQKELIRAALSDIKNAIDSLRDNIVSDPSHLLTNISDKDYYLLYGEILSRYGLTLTRKQEIEENDKECLNAYKTYQYYVSLLKKKFDSPLSLLSFRRVNEYCLQDLINEEITVSSSKTMNDPFDSLINIWGKMKHLKKLVKDKPHYRYLSESFDYYRIRSFAREYDKQDNKPLIENILMWSHYADSHKGICIKYSFSDHFICQDRNDNHSHMYLAPVNYESDSVNIDNLKSIDTQKAFYTKSSCWEYENEVRLINYDPIKTSLHYGIKLDSQSYVDSIYFGCRCSNEIKETIRNIFALRGEHPKYFDMKSDPRYVYQLKAIPQYA